jgi:hypothetical protein
MLSVAKLLAGAGMMCLAGFVSARDIHILVVGDESAGNCHLNAYANVPGVFQLDTNGQERPAVDPLTWSDCRGGSIWMPLAALLKQQPGVTKVVLMPVAVANAKPVDWTNGTAAARLSAALDVANAHAIRFDYALWQQGTTNRADANAQDIKQVLTVIKSATIRAKIDKWVIANRAASAVHPAKGEPSFKEDVVRRRYLGPNEGGLTEAQHLPNYQLTAAGQETMAQRWFDAIQRADKLNSYYQKESLLYFFK